MRMPGSRLLALVAVGTLLSGAACGGGSAKPTAAEDKATAARIVLTSADLPGFTREADDTEDNSDSPIDKCVNNNSLLRSGEKERGANGDNFTKDGGDLRVQSGATVAETSGQAAKAFSDLEGALSGQCVKDGLKKVIEGALSTPGVTVGEISASTLPAPKAGGDVSASRITVPLESADEKLSVFVDLTVLRQNRAFAGLFLFGSGSPFPESERTRLTTLLGERLSGKDKNTPDAGPAPTTPTTGRSSRATGDATAGFTEFRDPSGVTLQHPSDWTAEPSTADSPLLLFVDPPSEAFRRNVNIMQQSGSEPFTLDGYTALSLKQIADLPGATTGASGPTTLSGSPAHRLAYRANLGSGDLQFLAVWTVRSGKAWLVTYTADPAGYDAALPDVERVLPTIQLPD